MIGHSTILRPDSTTVSGASVSQSATRMDSTTVLGPQRSTRMDSTIVFRKQLSTHMDSTAVYMLKYFTRSDIYYTGARFASDSSNVVSDEHRFTVDRTIVSEAPIGSRRRMPRYRVL
jgi:hypothetical protein